MQKKTDGKRKIFAIFGKKSKPSVIESTASSDSLGDRSVSPDGSEESADRPRSLSPQPQVIQAPPRSKKRAAPKPPSQPNGASPAPAAPAVSAAGRPPSELSEGAESVESRHSSDSSGYHEAGLSDAPDSPSERLQAAAAAAPTNLGSVSSYSTSNLASSNLTLVNSASTVSLSSAVRKRRAPPPPIPKIVEDPQLQPAAEAAPVAPQAASPAAADAGAPVAQRQPVEARPDDETEPKNSSSSGSSTSTLEKAQKKASSRRDSFASTETLTSSDQPMVPAVGQSTSPNAERASESAAPAEITDQSDAAIATDGRDSVTADAVSDLKAVTEAKTRAAEAVSEGGTQSATAGKSQSGSDDLVQKRAAPNPTTADENKPTDGNATPVPSSRTGAVLSSAPASQSAETVIQSPSPIAPVGQPESSLERSARPAERTENPPQQPVVKESVQSETIPAVPKTQEPVVEVDSQFAQTRHKSAEVVTPTPPPPPAVAELPAVEARLSAPEEVSSEDMETARLQREVDSALACLDNNLDQVLAQASAFTDAASLPAEALACAPPPPVSEATLPATTRESRRPPPETSETVEETLQVVEETLQTVEETLPAVAKAAAVAGPARSLRSEGVPPAEAEQPPSASPAQLTAAVQVHKETTVVAEVVQKSAAPESQAVADVRSAAEVAQASSLSAAPKTEAGRHQNGARDTQELPPKARPVKQMPPAKVVYQNGHNLSAEAQEEVMEKVEKVQRNRMTSKDIQVEIEKKLASVEQLPRRPARLVCDAPPPPAPVAGVAGESASWEYQLPDPPTPFQDQAPGRAPLEAPLEFQDSMTVTSSEFSGGEAGELAEATNVGLAERLAADQSEPAAEDGRPAKPERRRSSVTRQMSFSIGAYGQREPPPEGAGSRLQKADSFHYQRSAAGASGSPPQVTSGAEGPAAEVVSQPITAGYITAEPGFFPESEVSDIQSEFLKLQKQFLHWQQQLLQNQSILQAKVAPLAGRPAASSLQSLQVIEELNRRAPRLLPQCRL
ncbi:calphotin-like [Pollicipes pollicipes]|uniref:calphotin-like n=1 Tax=Pollicipes pollicipes TaxID=41117 RepID=UPI0018855C8C|nr:calphotin-like [Pollicipes pollicipes]